MTKPSRPRTNQSNGYVNYLIQTPAGTARGCLYHRLSYLKQLYVPIIPNQYQSEYILCRITLPQHFTPSNLIFEVSTPTTLTETLVATILDEWILVSAAYNCNRGQIRLLPFLV